MVNVRKRGNVYEYNFDIAKIEVKRKRITKSGFKTYKIIHDELGIENCRLYDLRGSYATTILRNGVEIRDAADVLGHKDIETTENYYISSTDETRKNVTDSYESNINLDVIDEIIEYKISI
jgi:site-specific recombinase XerD